MTFLKRGRKGRGGHALEHFSDFVLRALPWIFIVYFFVIVFSVVYQRMLVVGYSPLNGTFQNYNPIHRILGGQFPGDGFQPYLGLGPTYLTTFYTWILGGDFAASLGGNSLAHLMNFVVIAWVITWLLPVRPGQRVMTLAIILVLSTVLGLSGLQLDDYNPIFSAWNRLMISDVPNLGLRSFLPFLTAALFMLLPHFSSIKI